MTTPPTSTAGAFAHKSAHYLFTAAVACIALSHELLIDAWFWALLRFLAGMAMAGLYLVIESWLNSYALPAHRSTVFSLYMAVSLGSLAFAPQFLHWGSPAGHGLFGVAALLVCAAAMPVSATRLSQPVIDAVSPLGVRNLYAKAPVAFVSSLFAGLVQGAFWGLSVVWAAQRGMDNSAVAAFMSLSVVGGALLQWPIGFFTDRLDRGIVISVVSSSAAVLALPMFFFFSGGSSLLLLVSGFLYGGFAFALYPLAVARMMDRLTPDEVFSGNGTLLLVYGIGAALSPVLVGSAMHYAGAGALPLWYILIELILAYAAWRMAKQSPADIEQQTPFVPMVRTATTAITILTPDPTDEAPAETVEQAA